MLSRKQQFMSNRTSPKGRTSATRGPTVAYTLNKNKKIGTHIDVIYENIVCLIKNIGDFINKKYILSTIYIF